MRSVQDIKGDVDMATYRAQIDGINELMPKAALQRLRDIRLFHWRHCVHHRKAAVWYREAGKENRALVRDGFANQHLKFVQSLNDFFPELGDTAERDDRLSSDPNIG